MVGKVFSRKFEYEIIWGIHILICFLFFSVLLVPYRYLNIAEWPVFLQQLVRHLPLVLSLGIGGLWMLLRQRDVWQCIKKNPLSLILVGLLGGGILSGLGAERVGLSLAKEGYYFITGGLLFIVVADLYEEKMAKRLILGFVCTGYVVALYGIFEIGWGKNVIFDRVFSLENEIYLQLSPDPWFGSRILSSVGHPVFLGGVLVMMLPLSFSFFQTEPRLVWKVGFLLGSLMLFVALLLTFSRGAWIAGGVAGLVYMILYRVRPFWYLIGAVGAVAGVLVLVFSVQNLSTTFIERVTEAYFLYVLDFASTSRGKALEHVIEILALSPLWGIGTGMYRFKAYVLGRDVIWPPTLDSPDNMYLLWLSELGMFGLFMVVFFCACFCRFFARVITLKNNKKRDGVLVGLAACFIGILINMVTCCALSFPTTRIAFWILTGAAFAYINTSWLQQSDDTPMH